VTTYSAETLKAYANVYHPTTKYALEVVNGLRVACKWEKLSCERHLKDLMRQDTDGFPYVFDETRANRIFDWFSMCCKHVRGVFSGQFIELLPFQKYDLGCLFGWVHKDSGRRRFIFSFNEIARGHAKSTIQSGIANFGLCSDCYYPPGEPEKRVYEMNPHIECAAYDKLQAKIVWDDALAMANASSLIKSHLVVKRTYIRHIDRGGHISPMSKETQNKDGLSPNIAIIDEYHAWRNSEVYDAIVSSLGKRAQSLVNIITTAGKNAENNPCKREEGLCKKILEGEIIDETYFINIRQLDEGDNPHHKKNWPKANPMLQEDNEYTRILKSQIENEYKKAYGSGDHAKQREFLTKRMNLWQEDTEQKFMSEHMDKFKALAVSRKEFEALVAGRECYNGLDLSKTTDLTASAYVFNLDDGRVAVTAHGFMPKERATQHENSDQVPYKAWAKEGWCTLTPGYVVDYKQVISHIHQMEFEHKWDIREICYDPYNANYCIQDIQREVDEEVNAREYECIEIRQGAQTLSEPTKYFRELVLNGRLVHDGSPLLTWCVSNAIEEDKDNGNIKLSKKHKDDSQRIDLLAATINAMVRSSVNEPEIKLPELTEAYLEAFYREGSGQEE